MGVTVVVASVTEFRCGRHSAQTPTFYPLVVRGTPCSIGTVEPGAPLRATRRERLTGLFPISTLTMQSASSVAVLLYVSNIVTLFIQPTFSDAGRPLDRIRLAPGPALTPFIDTFVSVPTID
jgi:hypothetical protein